MRKGLRLLNGGNVLGEVGIHETVEFVSHAWILVVGEDLVHGPREVARLVDPGKAVLGIEGLLGFQLLLFEVPLAHL